MLKSRRLATVVVAGLAATVPLTGIAVAQSATDPVVLTQKDRRGDVDPSVRNLPAHVLKAVDLHQAQYTIATHDGDASYFQVVYRAQDVRKNTDKYAQGFATIMSGKEAAFLIEATVKGKVKVYDMRSGSVSCAGATQTKDLVGNTVTQRVPLSCLPDASVKIFSASALYNGTGRRELAFDAGSLTSAVDLTEAAPIA